MTSLDDYIRYWGLSAVQASRHRTRVVRYWAGRTRFCSNQAVRAAYLAVALAVVAAAVAVIAIVA